MTLLIQKAGCIHSSTWIVSTLGVGGGIDTRYQRYLLSKVVSII